MTHATLMIRKCHPISTTMTKFKKVRLVLDLATGGNAIRNGQVGPSRTTPTPTSTRTASSPATPLCETAEPPSRSTAATRTRSESAIALRRELPQSGAPCACLPFRRKMPSSRAGLQHRVLHRPPQGLRDHPRVRCAARLQRPGPANRRIRRILCHKRVERRLRRPRAHDAGGDGPARPRHVRWKPRRHGRDRARGRRHPAGDAARL